MRKKLVIILTVIITFTLASCSNEPARGISEKTLNEEDFSLTITDYKVFNPIEGHQLADEPEIALFMEFTNNSDHEISPIEGIVQLYMTQKQGNEDIERNDDGELRQGVMGIVREEYSKRQDAINVYVKPEETIECMWSWKLDNLEDPVFCYAVDKEGTEALEGEIKFDIAGKAE